MLVSQSCPTLCDSMCFSPSDSSVHGILQARILEWVAIPSPGVGARVRHSAHGKGHEEGGSTYAKAGSSLRSPPVTTNKASGGDGIPEELFQILKMMLLKCCTQCTSKYENLGCGHGAGKGQFSFQSQGKAMPKLSCV